jgi:hypothetical protein
MLETADFIHGALHASTPANKTKQASRTGERRFIRVST